MALCQIRILASVENPYIIKFYEAFVDNSMLYIITEYAGNGDMFQRLKRLQQKRQSMPEDMAWVFFIQLCLGIQSLHKSNILHRYVKEHTHATTRSVRLHVAHANRQAEAAPSSPRHDVHRARCRTIGSGAGAGGITNAHLSRPP